LKGFSLFTLPIGLPITDIRVSYWNRYQADFSPKTAPELDSSEAGVTGKVPRQIGLALFSSLAA
jgi:hypothetical protein